MRPAGRTRHPRRRIQGLSRAPRVPPGPLHASRGPAKEPSTRSRQPGRSQRRLPSHPHPDGATTNRRSASRKGSPAQGAHSVWSNADPGVARVYVCGSRSVSLDLHNVASKMVELCGFRSISCWEGGESAPNNCYVRRRYWNCPDSGIYSIENFHPPPTTPGRLRRHRNPPALVDGAPASKPGGLPARQTA